MLREVPGGGAGSPSWEAQPNGVDATDMVQDALDDTVRLKAALRQLRWLLTSFQGSGIEQFHRQEGAPAPKQEALEEPVDRVVEGDRASDLAQVRQELGDCRRCRLHATRTNLVFGEGSAEAGLLFVGEGPGFDEDRLGRPFVGRAGKLLDKMIQAIGLRREDVYICNVVKCRPPENRTPEADEVAQCSPFLFRQIEAIRPKAICALGLSAAQALLGRTTSMGGLRGKRFQWRGTPMVCTYHPAYLLRNPAQKAAAWQDLRLLSRLLNEPRTKAEL